MEAHRGEQGGERRETEQEVRERKRRFGVLWEALFRNMDHWRSRQTGVALRADSLAEDGRDVEYSVYVGPLDDPEWEDPEWGVGWQILAIATRSCTDQPLERAFEVRLVKGHLCCSEMESSGESMLARLLVLTDPQTTIEVPLEDWHNLEAEYESRYGPLPSF